MDGSTSSNSASGSQAARLQAAGGQWRLISATALGWLSCVGPLLERLSTLPIFYKILVANSLIVVTGALAGSSLTLAAADSISPEQHIELIGFLAVVGTLVSVTVNFAVLKAALKPLTHLESAIEEVRRGNLSARAKRAPFPDPDIDKLTDTLNNMLDSMEQYRARLQAQSAQVLRAQEEERTRIARELHDTTGQLLTGLLLRLRALEDSCDAEVRQTACELLELTARTLEEVRRTAVELRPPALDDLGLVTALRGYIMDFGCNTSIDARFTIRNVSGRLPRNVELVLYRIVQEALTNAAKHAAPNSVRVSLEGYPGRVVARIEDDGRGFDVECMLRSRERGLGLFGMQERVSLLGGTLRITSRPGTRITAEIPLPPSFHEDGLA